MGIVRKGGSIRAWDRRRKLENKCEEGRIRRLKNTETKEKGSEVGRVRSLSKQGDNSAWWAASHWVCILRSNAKLGDGNRLGRTLAQMGWKGTDREALAGVLQPNIWWVGAGQLSSLMGIRYHWNGETASITSMVRLALGNAACIDLD